MTDEEANFKMKGENIIIKINGKKILRQARDSNALAGTIKELAGDKIIIYQNGRRQKISEIDLGEIIHVEKRLVGRSSFVFQDSVE
jgi:ATP-dependent exoDNAse (exonuclease V) alpha subunit